MKKLLEIAAFSVEGALAAIKGGADRIELCSSYLEGGLTPSTGTIEEIRNRCEVPLLVMIRPRGGNFVYTKEELVVMQRDIKHCRAIGVDGIVIGLLTKENRVDTDVLNRIKDASRELQITFHRAFDLCPDRDEALGILIQSHVDRILTSGGTNNASDGKMEIARLNKISAGKIALIAGGGITPGNIKEIAEATNCMEFHASAKLPTPVAGTPGFGEDVLPDGNTIRALKEALR
jgi:copper homeostasis protein